MSEAMQIYIAARTNIGRVRGHNEDDFLVCRSLDKDEWFFDNNIVTLGSKGAVFAIADGMGGEEAGEVASRIAIETIQDRFSLLEDKQFTDRDACEFLEKVIHDANKAIIASAIANSHQSRMGTTVVIMWVQYFRAFIAWVGDSRCYLFRNGRLTLTTDDHAPVWDLVKKGKISAEEARAHPDSNFISQHLGQTKDPIKPDTKTLVIQKGDVLLLCSDGLNAMLSDSQIENFVHKGDAINNTCSQLIEAANNAGGYDNITTILVNVFDEKPASDVKTSVLKSPKTTASIDEHFFDTAPVPAKKSNNRGKILFFFILALAAAMIVKLWQQNIFAIKENPKPDEITSSAPEGSEIPENSTLPKSSEYIPTTKPTPIFTPPPIKSKANTPVSNSSGTPKTLLPLPAKQIKMDSTALDTTEIKQKLDKIKVKVVTGGAKDEKPTITNSKDANTRSNTPDSTKTNN